MNVIAILNLVVAMVLCAVAIILAVILLFSVGLKLIDHANEALNEKQGINETKKEKRYRIVRAILAIISILAGSFMIIIGLGIIAAIFIMFAKVFIA